MKYNQIEFNINKWSSKRLRKITRFTKNEIRLLINYFDLKNIEYRKWIRFNSEFVLCLLLIKLL